MFPLKGVLKSNPPSLARSPSFLKGFLYVLQRNLSAETSASPRLCGEMGFTFTAEPQSCQSFSQSLGQQKSSSVKLTGEDYLANKKV